MRHPTDGTLRRLLDEPVGVADADRVHVAACPVCRSELSAARADAAAARAALHAEPAADLEAGWRRLSSAVAAESSREVPADSAHEKAADRSAGGTASERFAAGSWSRSRAALRSPAVAAAAVVILLTGAGVAAAAGWLPIFRTEQITPVTLTQPDLVALPDLSAYGVLQMTEEPNVHPVSDAAAVEEATGLSVPRVNELPRGVIGEPAYQVGGRVSAVFTFSAAKAAQAAATAGETLPPVPPGLDGSRFRMQAGPGLAAVWSDARGLPALIVARAFAPTGESSGVPFATARDYLLSLPGLPENVVSQLRSFAGDGTTLPLPLPAGLVTSTTADVGGVPAEVLTTRGGTMAGVVWVNAGERPTVTAVAGLLSADEVLSLARGLR